MRRTTLRTTSLLLLTLNFLFYSVCGDDAMTIAKVSGGTTRANPVSPAKSTATVSNADAMMKPATVATVLPTMTAKPNVVPTQHLTQATNPTVARPTIPTTVPTAAHSTQQQLTTVTNSPAAGATLTPATLPPVVSGATVAAASTSPPKTMTPAVTTKTAVITDQTTKPATAQATQTTLASKTTAVTTKPPSDLPSGPITTTKAPTTTPTTEQGSRTINPTTPTASRGDSTAVTKEAEKTSPVPTASRSTASGGNPETTATASDQTQPAVTVTAGTTPPKTTIITNGGATTSRALPKKFIYSLLGEQETKEDKELAEVCRRLMPDWQNGTCTLTWRHSNGKVTFDLVEINGHVKTSLAAQYYDDITKKPTDNKTLIAILASCGALLIMIVILAVCASHHRKPYSETQQHLTEELHTVENGYHDNPTLEVMEVQPEMQEKKLALNGEFNDSWIVPIDNLLKEDIPDEEDTHL